MRVGWIGKSLGWTEVLEAAGFRVVQIGDGGRALEPGEVDVVVCWGAWPPGRRWPSVPVVWCPGTVRACFDGDPARHAHVILPAPVRAVDLLRAIEEALDLRWHGFR